MISDIQFTNYSSFRNECNFTMEASSSETKPDNVFTTPISKNNTERLLKIAVIYGAKASGKTNIIRLLYSLRAIISKPPDTQGDEGVNIYDPFRLDGKSENEPTKVSISFIINGVKYVYTLEYNQDEFLSESLAYCREGVDEVLFEREVAEKQPNGLKRYKAKYGSSIPKSKYVDTDKLICRLMGYKTIEHKESHLTNSGRDYYRIERKENLITITLESDTTMIIPAESIRVYYNRTGVSREAGIRLILSTQQPEQTLDLHIIIAKDDYFIITLIPESYFCALIPEEKCLDVE